MSNITYEELLREAVVDISEQLEAEKPPSNDILPTNLSERRNFLAQIMGKLYLQYLEIIRKLETVYDQMLQPQERDDVKGILEATVGRFLEIKSGLIQLKGDYVDFDELLLDLKLTPDKLEVPIPRYFVEEREEEISRIEELVDSHLARHGDPQGFSRPSTASIASLSFEEAVRVIQINERGRQARQLTKLLRKNRQKELRKQEEMEGNTWDLDRTAITIQRSIRGFLAKKKVEEMRREELEFLGMIKDQNSGKKYKEAVEAVRSQRKMLQRQNKDELKQAKSELRTKILKEEGDSIKEAMRDMIMEKVILYRQKEGKVPEIPSEQEGGSIKFLAEMEETEAREQMEKDRKMQEEKAAAEAAKKKAKKQPAVKKKSNSRGKKEEEPQVETIVLGNSPFLQAVVDATKKYLGVWRDMQNPLDFTQKYNSDLLRTQILGGTKMEVGLEYELLKEVDEQLRQELSNLAKQVELDKKKPKKKKKKKSNAKKKTKQGKKKGSVHTQNTESLFMFLVAAGVIRKYPKSSIQDYIGEFLNIGSELNLVEPSMGQVRQIVSEVVLPLGSSEIHTNAPHVKSMLLFGPQKTGKTLLVHAMASEVRTVLFELHPKLLVETISNTKAAVETISIAFSVAKDMQPAIIWIDAVEKIFADKVKKNKTKIMKLRKEFLSQLKKLKPGERVLVVGTTSAPWEASMTQVKNFDRIVYTVRPDYASRLKLWENLIKKKEGYFGDSLDLHHLSYLSEGHTSGSIAKVVEDVLTEKRVANLSIRPLSTDEFITHLSKQLPVFKDVNEKFNQFVNKLPQKYTKIKEDPAEEKSNGKESKKKKRSAKPKR